MYLAILSRLLNAKYYPGISEMNPETLDHVIMSLLICATSSGFCFKLPSSTVRAIPKQKRVSQTGSVRIVRNGTGNTQLLAIAVDAAQFPAPAKKPTRTPFQRVRFASGANFCSWNVTPMASTKEPVNTQSHME